jgi:hypothetical protein
MANPFQKIPAGSPVTAFSITAWNRFLDMLNWWETSQGGGGPSKKIVDWDQTVFRVKNTTGYALVSYDPVGISGPIFSPTDADSIAELKNQTSMLGVEPTVANHAGGKWGVMLEAAADDAIGRCCLAGVVPVRVYVTSYLDTAVDVIAAETVGSETVYLGSGATGAKILWWAATSDSDDGTIVWAVVRLGIGDAGGGSWISFVPTQTFSTSDAAFSATVKSVHGTVPDAVDDAVTINNGDGVQSPPFSGDTTTIGICANYDPVTDAYYCIQLGCPPSGYQ